MSSTTTSTETKQAAPQASTLDASQPVIIVGGGLAGLVAAFELSQQNVRTLILEQENEACLGGQAFWSLGGIFCVDSAEQRRFGIKDSRERAMADWFNSARFDREKEDYWPRKWAEAFVNFATDEMESYVKERGMGFLLNVGWAERGDGRSGGHGNSIPRFHLTWGTGPEVVRVFEEPVRKAAEQGIVEFKFRHQVDEILVDESGRAVGVKGTVLEPSDTKRGVKSSRVSVGSFEFRGAPAVLVSSGGIGGNVEKVKAAWPVDRLGPKVPQNFVVGVPAHVDGRGIDIARAAGGSVVNADRMWHYTEGLRNWDPIWPDHGIRVLPGPSSLWLDATGKRLPPPLFPGADTLATLKHICSTGYDYTWFVLDQAIVAREFALSGSEQNPDITSKSIWQLIRQRLLNGGKGTDAVQAFVKNGPDFIVRDTLPELVEGMNALAREVNGPQLQLADIDRTVKELNMQLLNDYCKDAQVMLCHNARAYWPDKISRVAKQHALTDKAYGPLIAVKMNLLTRKSLGGLETDLDSNVIRASSSSSSSSDSGGGDAGGGERFPGLYAAGEAAGFGGGGVHGYSSLEGTFLGGCIFSGRAAGRAIARAVVAGKEV